jgi:glutamine synthetase
MKAINIEALTMLEMAKRQILPAVIEYTTMLADSINTIKTTGIKADISVQEELLTEVSTLTATFRNDTVALEKTLAQAADICGDTFGRACFYRDQVFVKMGKLRETGDKLETMVGEVYWPLPTYGDLLFNV